MAIRTVGIIGTGVIGASWTGLFLAYGLQVIVADPADGAGEKLAEHLKSIWPTLEKVGVAKGASLSNYRFVGPSLKDHYAEVDFVQENAPERVDLKTRLIAEIDAATRSDVVIASSSSGLPSSKFIGDCVKNPGRVLIGHPFNPPHVMQLVEVVPHAGTDQASTDIAMAFYRSLGRHPVLIRQEIPGFAVNRLQAVLCNEAYSLVTRGIVTAEELDACMTTSLGPRWAVTGPLMSNAMGGGGGSDGFRHMLEHLGPATRGWLDDTRAHSFQWDLQSLDKLSESVFDELKDKNVAALEQKRDSLLVEIFRLKK